MIQYTNTETNSKQIIWYDINEKSITIDDWSTTSVTNTPRGVFLKVVSYNDNVVSESVTFAPGINWEKDEGWVEIS